MKRRKSQETTKRKNRLVKLVYSKTFNKVVSNLSIVIVIILLLVFLVMNPTTVGSDAVNAISESEKNSPRYFRLR